MAIVSGEIEFHLSGTGGTPASSLGGAIHATEITDATLHNLFDPVDSGEASSGDVEYRCLYVKNANTTLTLYGAVIWIDTNTPSADTTIDIGLGTSAINGTEQTIADESIEPTSVSWSAPASKGAGLSIGDIPSGEHKAIWVRRTINASAASASSDSAIIKVEGATLA